MKTKKQLAAAAAAAAAAAEKRAANAPAAGVSLKKPLKRLHPKGKETPPKVVDSQSSQALPQPSKPVQPITAKGKATTKLVVGPKSPVPTKLDTAGVQASVPPGKVATTPSGSAKVNKPTKHDTALIPVSPTGTSVKASGLCSPKGSASIKKVELAKGKKPTPTNTGGKKSSAGEKKKIQKELKNLGITDRTINQLDATVVECNPSISEMVKTKSRATVSQQKYNEIGSVGGPSGSTQKTTVAASSVKPEGYPALMGSSDGNKPTESVSMVSAAANRKKASFAQQKTKDTPLAAKEDTKREAADREEGAKNKSPVMALPTPAPPPLAAKEDVKAPAGAKTNDSKTKAKKPESNDDDNDNGTAENKTVKRNTFASAVTMTAVPKAKPRSKKAILEEKRAAEAKAAAEVLAAMAQPASGSAVIQAEDKQKVEEEKTCSLVELETDDRHEADVQSRIEDIVKALEEEDDEEEGGITHPKADEIKIVPQVNDEQSPAAKEKKQIKVVKPKSSKSVPKKPRKAPAKKPPPNDEKVESNVVTLNDSISSENNTPAVGMSEKQLISSYSAERSTKPSEMEVVTVKSVPTSTAKRKYVRKPKNSGGVAIKVPSALPLETQKSATSPKHAPEIVPISLESQHTPQKDASAHIEPPASDKQLQTIQSSKCFVKTNEMCPLKPMESPEPPKTIRSSTENYDDVPLNRLKNKTKPPTNSSEVFTVPPKPPISVEPASSGSSNPPTPLLASLLSKPVKSRRKYVRKNPVTPGPSGSKKQPPKRSLDTPKESSDKKSEKKDVYDFDDSESDIDTPVKAGKPIFKRKPLESSSSLRDEDEFDDTQQLEVKSAKEVENIGQMMSEKKLPASDNDSELEKKSSKPIKKSSKSEDRIKSPEGPPLKMSSSESEHSNDDDDGDDDEDYPHERPRTPISRKVKQEVRDSSGDENDDDDDDDSDGYSSEESVRTRIVKKRLTAKTRHLKLYGFWSGPKRHRVASLNAIAKVHCLYENETRAALEASLTKQSKGSKAVAAKVVKKEKTEDDDKKKEVCDAKEDKKDVKSDKKLSAQEKKEKEDDKKQKAALAKEEKKKVCKLVESKEEKKKEGKKVEVKENKKDSKKKEKEKPKEESTSDSEDDESEEEVVTRTLRCVPGLRGVGKHWDPNASSMESEDDLLPDSDETYAQGKDTDPVKKRKVKRKIVKKAKPKPKSEKSEKSEKPDKPKPPAKKIKKELKALMSDSERQAEDESGSSSSESEKVVSAKPKQADSKKRKRKPKEKKEVVEVLAKKRMASLNATAMLAATYEVQRILYRNTDSDSDNPAHKPKTKKAKEQKEAKEREAAKAEEKKEAKESKESKEAKREEKPAEVVETVKSPEIDKSLEKEETKEREHENTITIKTELLRDKKDETEVKRELEEPRPMSSNVVIAQDTEVTITGVYVNSTLGANQEAYCKMQYRVQQSVTEERLVRPGEAPPRSYTPLTALSSMRPPNDQTLTTPPLFGPPSQCDSPLGLGPPRSFYPPPTSSSGSSSAFCAPIPHDSPGYYQPAGPLISPHLLPQPPPGPPSSTSQHSASSSTVTKQPPESDSPLQSLTQPPSSSTADSTDSDVLLTGGDLSSRSQAYRYGPSGPPNIYPRPVQMHCPPPHLAPNYYAAPPYSQYPPEMYYTHAYPPAHFYPKFAQYYPSRRYYPGPPGPGEHLYEQAPPPSSAPVPPPAGAQLVPAGPQGPQHMDHYPGPPPYPYPGYGSPGPGPGGQCYSRNLQPPPYMDAHYTTNCPCPMQSCPKNVNAGSLIGIKASKGPVATVQTPNHHIATTGVYSAVQTATVNSSEPIMISSGSSTSSSPPPLDIHAPIVCPAEITTSSIYATPTTTTTPAVSAACTNAPVCTTNTTTITTTCSNTTMTEPNRTPNVKPESDLYQCSKNYHLHHHHYHHNQRPSAPPPTHPLQHFDHTNTPLLAEVKEEPSTPTPESEFKSAKNIPKLIPITAAMVVKQEISEVKQELSTVVICKKEDFEENGPAMTPDLLLDEALIKKEELVTELLLPDRCFVQNKKLDDKCLLSNILTTEANLINRKTTGSDICSSDINSVNNSNHNNNINSRISNEKVQLVDSVLPEIPASTVKRRPLLVACKKSTPKKSPPNSYKNLIKRTNLDEESTITVLSDDDEEEDEEEAVIQKVVRRKLLTTKPRKILKRTRRIFGAEQARHLRKLSRTLPKSKRIRKVSKRPSCVPRNPEAELSTTDQQAQPKHPETITILDDSRDDSVAVPEHVEPANKIEVPEQRVRPMSNVDLTIDLVAKGYFSEPEILSQEAKTNTRTLKKLKQQEGRSQSEQNRGKRERSSESKHSSKKTKNLDSLDVDFDKRKSKCKSKKIQSDAVSSSLQPSPISPFIQAEKETRKASKAAEKEKKPKKEPKQNSKKKSIAKIQNSEETEQVATSTPVPPVEDQQQFQQTPTTICAEEPDPSVDDRETDFDDAATMLVEDDMMSVDTNTMINRHNNNNSSTVENKNALGGEDPMEESTAHATVSEQVCDQRPTAQPDEVDEEEEIMLARRFAKKNAKALRRAARSRSKSKSRKFSIKKRHRIYRMTAEVEEVIVPRKCNSVPRWSNGWTWEGQPFQGKVFLNSDDLPVLRTCYPAMRHSEGDIIRPRDCVLLRAGSKRAELPYVAKVAHLWENPEDGEMMMSLLWYYRPEHTEQGRQTTDGPDEVFASRHKDHNSVACIEDKCYVLTFSEYCRFRRHLKGFEENIVEHPSIVPALRRENTRLPPPIVSPELVMYCQRVYEFRLKRLLKTPS
ncbi:titin-like [Topomyia yanbarensis]|uniref:titin-like n=1 Tax=Topomyia yanbarensis TaxID=2498891 RepID=UPI00273AB334|nr:titin-like [Topomyia yanbarensis]